MAIRYLLQSSAAAIFLAAAPAPANAADTAPVGLSVATTLTFEGSTQTADEESALHAKARVELYKMAAGECAVVSRIINADCKLRQIQINTRSVSAELGSNRGLRDGVIATGTFTFALTPRP